MQMPESKPVTAHSCYVREAGEALHAGDRVDGEIVLGFAFVTGNDQAGARAADDRLLLAGEDLTSAAEPPDHPVPLPGTAEVNRTEWLPPHAVSIDHVRDGAAYGDDLRAEARAVLDRVQADHGCFVDALLDRLHAAGHLTWMTGGAARDLVADGSGSRVRDIDLTGTAPTGWFSETVRTTLEEVGAGHLRQKVSDILVSSLETKRGGPRLIEYRALNLPGFRFQASGGNMKIDAHTRDFTVNSLYYDPRHDIVLDPTGQALSDLRGSKRRLVPMHTDENDHTGQGVIIMRAMKFWARWSNEGVDVDVEPLDDWLAGCRPDLLDRIPESRWDHLLRVRSRTLADIPKTERRKVAMRFGPLAVELMDRLDAFKASRRS